jgi:predicted DCC family thiol-disulfide oxidoreductase YuxK
MTGNRFIVWYNTRFAYDRFADLLFAWNRRKRRW